MYTFLCNETHVTELKHAMSINLFPTGKRFLYNYVLLYKTIIVH